jgi:hypothetical protein
LEQGQRKSEKSFKAPDLRGSTICMAGSSNGQIQEISWKLTVSRRIESTPIRALGVFGSIEAKKFIDPRNVYLQTVRQVQSPYIGFTA